MIEYYCPSCKRRCRICESVIKAIVNGDLIIARKGRMFAVKKGTFGPALACGDGCEGYWFFLDKENYNKLVMEMV